MCDGAGAAKREHGDVTLHEMCTCGRARRGNARQERVSAQRPERTRTRIDLAVATARLGHTMQSKVLSAAAEKTGGNGGGDGGAKQTVDSCIEFH
jgi:hypothetical protein